MSDIRSWHAKLRKLPNYLLHHDDLNQESQQQYISIVAQSRDTMGHRAAEQAEARPSQNSR